MDNTKKINPGLIVSLMFILLVVIYAAWIGFKIKESNLITAGFIDVFSQAKGYLFSWIAVLLFAVIVVYFNLKKQ